MPINSNYDIASSISIASAVKETQPIRTPATTDGTAQFLVPTIPCWISDENSTAMLLTEKMSPTRVL